MRLELKLSALLDSIEDAYEVKGETDRTIEGFANLPEATAGDLSFVQSRKYAGAAATTQAGVLIVPRDEGLTFAAGTTLIVVDHPSRVLSQICGRVESLLYPVPSGCGIHSSAVLEPGVTVDPEATIGAYTTLGQESRIAGGCSIGARVSIGAHSDIGKGVRIADNCVIAPHTSIGEGTRIFSGAVIGSSGFGYEFNAQTSSHDPIPQIGRVAIGKHVDIGANTTIDRARIGETRIGDGTKIDNLVQIGHNVKIGRHCILCAFVGISGSVTLGDYVVLAGRVGVADHLEIANGVQVGGGAAVTSRVLEQGSKLWGVPALDYGLAMKIAVLQRKLPDLFKRVGAIEKLLEP